MINEQGYEAINVNDIAYKAKVSVGTLYYHFPKGKKSILTHILSQLTSSYLKQFKDKIVQESILSKSGSFDKALQSIFKTIIDLRRNDRQFLAVLQTEMLRDLNRYETLLSELETSDAISDGLGTFVEALGMLSSLYPDKSLNLPGNEKQLIRIIGTLLTNQIIFEDYYGSDEEFVEILSRLFNIYTRSNGDARRARS
jgi:AcrR family transcriptional regulator